MPFTAATLLLSQARTDADGLHWVPCPHCGREVLVNQALPPRAMANFVARHWFVVHCDTEPVPECINHGLSFLRADLEFLVALKGHVVRSVRFTLQQDARNQRRSSARV